MAEHVADFEWRGEGDETEIAVYAPDETAAVQAIERSLPAAGLLPGVESPVHAAASRCGFGRYAASKTHVAPGLVSAPGWGLLLVTGAPPEVLGVPFEETQRLLERRLSEVAPPGIGDAALRDLAETGARWAAEEGLIEEDDLPPFASFAGDPDALGRRAISAGTRDWTRPARIGAWRVAEVHDEDTAGELGLERGTFAVVVEAGAEDLGRLALTSHRERISSVDFGPPTDLPVAPSEAEEARDVLAAVHAAANYAAGRAALVLWALRRALPEVGSVGVRAAWVVGGVEERDGHFAHRDGLAAVDAGEALISGSSVVVGTGKIPGSAPPFGVSEEGRGVAVGGSGVVRAAGGVGAVRESWGWGVGILDLLMVRERESGTFVYVERLERRSGETSWEYVRRSVRREGKIRDSYADERFEVLVGWGTDSVEEFLRSYPEYRPPAQSSELIEGG